MRSEIYLEAVPLFARQVISIPKRGGALPSWAAGEGLTIGSHTFYFPEESDASPQRTGLTMVLPSRRDR